MSDHGITDRLGTHLGRQTEGAWRELVVGEFVRDHARRQVAERRAIPLLQHRAVSRYERRCHDV